MTKAVEENRIASSRYASYMSILCYAMRPFTVMDNNADMSIDANITSGDIRFRADRQGFFALGFGDDNEVAAKGPGI